MDVDFSRNVENNLNLVPVVVGLEAPAVDLEDEAVCFKAAETGFKAVASNPEAEPVGFAADFILEVVNLEVCKFGLVAGVASDDCFARAIFSFSTDKLISVNEECFLILHVTSSI